MDVVADDADVVGRGRPGERRLAGAAGRGQAGRARSAASCPATVALACVRGGADVAGGVLGGDLVEVGAGGEAGVGVARAGRLGDPVAGARREAGRRAAVDVVAGDADVVGRGRPGERRPCVPRRVAARPLGALGGVVSAIGRRDLVRGGAEVAGRVLGGHLVVVGAEREDARVGCRSSRSAARSGSRRSGVKPARRAAVDVVAGDADVVASRPSS